MNGTNEHREGIVGDIVNLLKENASLQEQLASERALRKELVEGLNDLYMHTPNLDWNEKPKTTFDVSFREAILNAQNLIKKHRENR